jgi:YfiH family protein
MMRVSELVFSRMISIHMLTKLELTNFDESTTPHPDVLQIPEWAKYSWLIHGFSTRGPQHGPNSGGFDLGFTAMSNPETVSSNRQIFLTALYGSCAAPMDKLDRCGLVTLKQMHSALARRAGRADISARANMWGDGLFTDEPGVILGIQTADCFPILIADTRCRNVAAFHAGWRGTLKRIVEHGVESMRREFGSEPEDLTAAIGPGIGPCCFEVGAEVRDLFQDKFDYSDDLFLAGSRLTMDLVEANRRQLLTAGVPSHSIFALRACTSCHTDMFFSYRAERGKTGRLMSAIGIAAS